jgi:DNA polymerase II
LNKKVFLLTRNWKDLKKNVIVLYGTSMEDSNIKPIPIEIIINRFKPVFFIERDKHAEPQKISFYRKKTKLKNFNKKDVDAIYFNKQVDLKQADAQFRAKGINTYEADVDPVKRFLMERNINVQAEVKGKFTAKNKLIRFINPEIMPCSVNPDFKIISIDIETSKNNTILSIAAHLKYKTEEIKKVFIIGEQKKSKEEFVEFIPSEKNLLNRFIEWFNYINPDIIIGWNVIGFDLMFIERRANQLGIALKLARGNNNISIGSRKSGGYFAEIPGRIVFDGPIILRSSFYSFEDYKLETVAQEILGKGKLLSFNSKQEEIDELFEKDKRKLAEYNLQDAVLVSEIFEKTGIINHAVKRAQISGMFLNELGMMTKAFDHFYLPKLHQAGFVAPNIKDIKETSHSAGGYVIDPVPGIYQKVILLDFKSLYPSIIRTFKIDPLSRLLSSVNPIKTPNGYQFSRTENFLPEFIGKLLQQRNEAINKGDKYLSQAIKILMNSFYGVMGAYNCRFYHPTLPSAITGIGQWLLLQSKSMLNEKGYEVIYGDTDSLFVLIKNDEDAHPNLTGNKIAGMLNEYWVQRLKEEFNLESYFNLEFEKFYKKFIITPARGGETGAKKRYAGLVQDEEKEKIEFVGMEFVRSDWTKLAKEFQTELYRRIFYSQDIKEWMQDTVKKVYDGLLDDKLIYKKRLRKNPEDYINLPPQVKAAKMINKEKGTIEYFITKQGPVPIELSPHDIDYEHYIQKQLKPIADSVLVLLDESFDSIINQSSQLDLFI